MDETRNIAEVLFRRQWFDMGENLPDEARLELYDLILRRAFKGSGDNVKCSPLVSTLFPLVRAAVDAEVRKVRKYDAMSSGKDVTFEECWKQYRRKGNKKNSRYYWARLTDGERAAVQSHIAAYTRGREVKYQKDFERYLRDKVFLDTVYDSANNVIFDPSRGSVYTPALSPLLVWNEFYKCYMYVGYWDGTHISDGYSDEERPEGARITLNNGRGTIVWNAVDKKWKKER